MYTEVEYKGKEYSLEIPKRGRIEVLKISTSPAGGAIANALRGMGKEPTSRCETVVGDDERSEIILACGWKFSKSKTWRDEWDYLYRKAGSRKSGWGKKVARRVV
jgi:hypothetical protein